MFSAGINTWAPIFYERRARAVFLTLKNTKSLSSLRASSLSRRRADCIIDALAQMYLYSGIDVRMNYSSHRASDIETIR